MRKITFPDLSVTIQIFREGQTYVAHNPELNVSSCGDTLDQAKSNLKDALVGFLKSAQKLGTLEGILEEAGYVRNDKRWVEPQLVLTGRLSLVS
ncbi:MAG: type II toxin-antitoxin system HicB family antitoxin [Candidatus Vogelbacteria bacterium]|nr:type II toxin-antitoxin system HicB family antitoxin [Candidatus Vogelbacteria bacterium]